MNADKLLAYLRLSAFICVSFLSWCLLPVHALAQAFSFAAIGDTPYTVPRQFESFARLIERINGVAPAFTVHVGDFKGGATPCDDAIYSKILGMFGAFEQPLVYIPGDNEWTDCHRQNNGAYDPRERLDRLRELFFARPQSLGRRPMALERQAADPAHGKYVENARWTVNRVQFATVHVVGSNNNLQRDAAALGEYAERNAANLAWIRSTFAAASKSDAKALVLIFHGDPGWELEGREDQRSGFSETLRVLKAETLQFARPVLFVHGDKHRFVVDKPLYQGRRLIYNATRLMVFGDAEVHGVLVGVDPDDRDVFSFRTLTVPANVD